MKTKYFIISLLLSWMSVCEAQTQIENRERVYLTFDRTTYLTGETIWFSALLYQQSQINKPGVSRVAYIEILDPNGKPALHGKFEISNGKGSGNVFLPATLETGLYTVNAYTAWMRNEGPEVFFHASLLIINPFQRMAKPEPFTSELKLYPESGTWTLGAKNRMVVRYEGSPEDVTKGILIGVAKDTLAKFKLDEFGMASIDFKSNEPQVRLLIQFRNGKWREEKMPLPGLYSASVRSEESKIEAILHSNPNSTESCVAQILFKDQIKELGKTIAGKEVQINWSDVGTGINEIRWVNGAGEILASRLVFKKPTEALASSLKLIVSDSVPGKRNKISVSIQTSENSTVDHLMITVKKKNTLERWNQTSLTDYNLIDHPNFFLTESLLAKLFTEPLKFVDQLLILGHQPAKERIQSKNHLPEINGPILEGYLKSLSGVPAKGVQTYLSIPSKYIRVYPAVSDDNGRILFEPMNFYGAGKLILQTENQTDSLYQMEWRSPFADNHRFVQQPFPTIPKSLSDEILERSLSLQTNSLFPWGIGNVSTSDTGAFYGKPDEHYNLDDFTRFPVMEEVLREYVYGIRLRKRDGKFSFQMHDIAEGVLMEKEPLVLIDGVPFFETEKIMGISPLKIKSIDLVSRTYFLNGSEFSGIASFRTYKGDMGGAVLNKNIHVSESEGLLPKKEFQIKNPSIIPNRIPDQRTILLWNPEHKTASKGKASFEFFTSDLDGHYLIEARGFNLNAVEFFGRQVFRVK